MRYLENKGNYSSYQVVCQRVTDLGGTQVLLIEGQKYTLKFRGSRGDSKDAEYLVLAMPSGHDSRHQLVKEGDICTRKPVGS